MLRLKHLLRKLFSFTESLFYFLHRLSMALLLGFLSFSQSPKSSIFSVDAFMLPDGSYRMSQTQASEAVGLSRQNVSDFLRSNAIKILLGEGYTSPISGNEQIEIESEGDKRGQSRFNSLPLEIVGAYWLWQSYRGNKKALSICMALIIESLERRFDDAFGVVVSEKERNRRLSQRNSQLERDLANLGEGFAIDADKDREIAYLTSLLGVFCINPRKGGLCKIRFSITCLKPLSANKKLSQKLYFWRRIHIMSLSMSQNTILRSSKEL